MTAVIFAGLVVIANMFGLSLIALSYHVLLPWLILGIHIVSAVALFRESKKKKRKWNETVR